MPRESGMTVAGFAMAASERQLLETRMQAVRDPVIQAAPDESFERLLEFRRDSDRLTGALRQRLFTSSLVADESDDAAVRWICAQHHRLARLAKRIAESIARRYGPGDDRCLQAAAIALDYMAESVKGEIAAGMRDSHHHARAHAMMRLAMSAGRHREDVAIRIDGGYLKCTLEALYLRALLLARVSTGGLTMRQIEIFDAYFMNHLEVLRGFDSPPAGATWRADIDSLWGLRAGLRKHTGTSIYLPLAPLERAYREIVAEFHAGRIFPAHGGASQFPVEDHVAVLDLMRRTLRVAKREPVGRAKRYAVNATVEVHMGFAAIVAKGFDRKRRAVRATLATVDGLRTEAPRRQTEFANALGSVYEPPRKTLQLVNISHTGMGLEGSEAACAAIAPGDLMGVQLHEGEPMVLAKVVRRVASAEGRMIVGAERISAAARVVSCQPEIGDRRPVSVIYIPGDEPSGSRDCYVAPESLAVDRREFSTRAAGKTFVFRFNRVVERGRGWVLAGFQVVAAEKATEKGSDSFFRA